MTTECICAFRGSRNKQRIFPYETSANRFMTQAGLVYCAVRSEYSFFFFLLSCFTYFLLLITMATSAGESVVISCRCVGEPLFSHELRITDSFCTYIPAVLPLGFHGFVFCASRWSAR